MADSWAVRRVGHLADPWADLKAGWTEPKLVETTADPRAAKMAENWGSHWAVSSAEPKVGLRVASTVALSAG